MSKSTIEIYKSLVAIDKHVIFTWIPSHIGIHGNTVVDHEAKNALDYTDFKSKSQNIGQQLILFSSTVM
jgi:ribonuclease HI